MSKRSKTVSDDDVFHGDPHFRYPEPPLELPGGDPYQVPFLAMVGADRLMKDILYLLSRGDGWLRLGCDLDGKVCFIKYKLTSVSWPNHYVYVSGPVYDISLHFASVVRKLELLDAGQFRPTTDRPYQHD